MSFYRFPVFISLLPSVLGAQLNTKRADPVPAFKPLEEVVARNLSGQNAWETVRFVEQFYRLPGNRGYDASIDTVVRLLETAGYRNEKLAGPGDRFTWRIEEQAMSQSAWSPLDASITITGTAQPLMTWAGNHNMIAANSYSTPQGGVEAELVDVGSGTEADFARVDVKGKIVMGDLGLRQLVSRALDHGALGALATQRLPGYNQQQKNTTAIQFSSITRDDARRSWGLFLSLAAATELRAGLAKGPIRLRVVISTAIENRPERSLVAEIRGSVAPEERIVYSAHVQEPGANDNATGVGTLAEVARVAVKLTRDGTVDARRTITFLWGNEISWTGRYLAEDSVRRAGVKWGMSLDMTGEDTEKTGGTFLIEKMQDPSAVWVRGEDQHSEWGGRPIPIESIRPYWLNDFTRQRCLARANSVPWVVKSNPYEGGSDHTPFISAGIPAVLFWHFTDQYYHTDRDRLEMVSARTMENVGNCALVTGLIMSAGTLEYTRGLLEELTQVAEHELRVQAELSRNELQRPGADLVKERLILATWRDYYVNALGKVPELHVGPSQLTAEVSQAQERVRNTAAAALASLQGL